MFILVFGLFANFCTTVVESGLLVFWGYPTGETTYCVNTTVVSFENCKETCGKSLTCMLASGKGTNCMLCDIYTVTEITRSTGENGIRTAVKINNSEDGKCPSDMVSTIFSGQYNENNTYSLKLSSDVVTIKYTKTCKVASWRMFPRPFGPFCLVVANNTTPISRSTAANACTSKWGIGLTALNSIAERNYVIETGRALMGKHSEYKYSSIWLNGALRADCNFVGSEKTTECAGMKAFEYIGSSITSFEAYQFAAGSPNYTKIGTSSQSCLQLMVSQSETENNGLVRNAVCGDCNEDDSICALTFVCGY
ncbi:unnamed protein product [Caenorhabditis brenneri]